MNFTTNRENAKKIITQMKADKDVNLAILYIPIPDGFGHSFGKNSREVSSRYLWRFLFNKPGVLFTILHVWHRLVILDIIVTSEKFYKI